MLGTLASADNGLSPNIQHVALGHCIESFSCRSWRVHSTSSCADDYIASFDGEVQVFLCALRELIFDIAPTAQESMQYRMPSYGVQGRLFAFAVQKRHISVYVCSGELIERYTNDLGCCSLGKGCIRYRRPEHADLQGLRRLLQAVYS